MAGEAHTLGFGITYDMVAARTACGQLLTLTSHQSGEEIPPHRHVNDYLCIVLSGGFAEKERNSWRERPNGCFFTHHAGEMHHDRVGKRGAMCLNLHFDAGEPAPAMNGVCSAEATVTGRKLAFELAAGRTDDLAIAALSAEFMGYLGGRETARRDVGIWIDRVVEAISDEPDRRWSLAELAAIAGRHPVRVAQAFRAKTGISLGSFQRLRRLTCLSLALRRGDAPLASLAAEFGYCDQAHMTGEFRAAFGVTPARYRRLFH